ncbi:hypothetical protein ANO14919_123670 [Xylariales sp. No.14919]|nr:hypothetical protein ANO14919_123670 [Xylariales sp. No.14919]
MFNCFEFQGWGDTTFSTQHTNDSLLRLGPLEYSYQYSQDNEPSGNRDIVANAAERTGEEAQEPPKKYGYRTWLVMFALCVTQLLNAFEGTVASTALPTIVADLDGGEAFI